MRGRASGRRRRGRSGGWTGRRGSCRRVRAGEGRARAARARSAMRGHGMSRCERPCPDGTGILAGGKCRVGKAPFSLTDVCQWGYPDSQIDTCAALQHISRGTRVDRLKHARPPVFKGLRLRLGQPYHRKNDLVEKCLQWLSIWC